MEIEVSILWVDNAPDFAVSIAQKLSDWLEEKGLELKPTIRKDSSTVLKDIEENDFELIVVDYLLGGETGDTLIDKIRQNKCFQDVVFYTAGPIEPLYQKPRDGVFYVAKNFAETRIQQLMELKLWRLSDPASVRGWVVADAIELEEMITEIFLQCHTQKDGLTFSERLFGHNSPLDFGAKFKILNYILHDLSDSTTDPKRKPAIDSCKNIFKKFPDEVIEVRNALAHQKVEKAEGGKIVKKKIKDATIIPLTDESFTKIRRDFRKHRDNLVAIRDVLRL